MNRILKIIGLIVLEAVIIALLVGLVVVTVWLFRQDRGANWGVLSWISVLTEGIVTLIIIPFALIGSFSFIKDKICTIRELD